MANFGEEQAAERAKVEREAVGKALYGLIKSDEGIPCDISCVLS